MKPNDDNGSLPPEKRPLRVLIIAGSNRRQYNCPGVDSKARTLMLRMEDRLPQEWEIDVEDLSNVYGRPQIQGCNACVSTSMALCCWPCNCYQKNDSKEPDLMWDMDLYARLDLADAWAVIGPVNWYGPTTTLKRMFDRLVCMNGGNPREELIDHKNPELAMKLEKSPEWQSLTVNHLEGRTAGFFCYGDKGGDEVDESGRPKILKHKDWFNPADGPEDRDAYLPLVMQCRWSGIEVPEELLASSHSGVGLPYADNQAEDMVRDPHIMQDFDDWIERFASFVGNKGPISPGKYRAYGYVPPSHRTADLWLKWRELRIRLGYPPKGSSPAAQQAANLNQDATWNPKKSEGSKRREEGKS